MCSSDLQPDVIQCYHNVADKSFERSGLKKWVLENQTPTVFFSALRQGLLLGKYTERTEFCVGDFRRNIAGFTDIELLDRLASYAKIAENLLPLEQEPLLSALIAPLIRTSPKSATLIGARNVNQLESISKIQTSVPDAIIRQIKKLYDDIEI